MIKRERGKTIYEIDGSICKIHIYGVHKQYRGTAIIDAENYDKCSKEKWFVKFRKGIPMCVCGHVDGKRNVRMHHFLFGEPPDGMEYDHENRNPLDNRERNARLCTCPQNQWNRGLLRRNTSGFKGVVRSGAKCESWTATIWHKRKPIYLGSFENKIDAAISYNNKALELKQDFAYLNPISGRA